jgi:flagellin FlaB
MLRKLKRHSFLLSNRGSIGVGGMIVFIAMVLVAGIAASVLISTSNTLETQAMQSGRETRNEVAAGIRVYQIIGNFNTRNIGGTDYTRYHNMSIMVTPCAGTDGIDLAETVITVANESKQVALSYGEVFSASSSGSGVFSTPGAFDLTGSQFSIIVIEDRDNSCTAAAQVINEGDKVLLNVNLSACFNGLRGHEDIHGMVIIEEGAPGVFLFRTPGQSSRSVVEFL